MAIDFMIMPLSRYIAGDFISPMMRTAWDAGSAYTIVGRDGLRQFPPGLPFGGPDAAARRMQIVDEVVADLHELPAPVPARLWDERSTAEPCFHRVDPGSFGELLEEASKRSRGFLGMFGRRATHLRATLLLPCPFDAPFQADSPIVGEVASAPGALAELGRVTWSAGCASAVETFGAALDDAVRLRLPLIVDL